MKPCATFTAVVTLCSLAVAGDREFDAIVRSVEARCDTSHTRIPLLGLANFAVKVVRPAGAFDLKLAVFEDLRRPIFAGKEDFGSLIQGALGPDWRPFVRVHSRRNNEWTCIYASGFGKQWKLLVAAAERREATIVRIKLNPDGLMRWISRPSERAKNWQHD
jgi:hypothetical protein